MANPYEWLRTAIRVFGSLHMKASISIPDFIVIAQEQKMTESTASTSSTSAFDPSKDIKTHIADYAKRITNGARRQNYGTPEQNFERIARFWNDYLKNKGVITDDIINPTDVSLMMVLMKIARISESPDHLDSYCDLVGYALTAAETQGIEVPETVNG